MTTYQKGHEPAGAPVTWIRFDPLGNTYYSLFDHRGLLVEVRTEYQASEIARLAHAAAEWRKLAEEARSVCDVAMDISTRIKVCSRVRRATRCPTAMRCGRCARSCVCGAATTNYATTERFRSRWDTSSKSWT